MTPFPAEDVAAAMAANRARLLAIAQSVAAVTAQMNLTRKDVKS